MSEEIELRIFDTGEVLEGWTSYRYSQDFLTPTDEWDVAIGFGDSARTARVFESLMPGTRVSLVIDDKAQCTGYVDARTLKRSREGTQLHVRGRDVVAPMVDASVDPLFVLGVKATLNDVLAKIATPFGFGVLSTTDIANRDVLTGNLKSKTQKLMTTPAKTVQSFEVRDEKQAVSAVRNNEIPEVIGEYDPTRPKFLKDIELTTAKPHPGEGCFEFCARLAKRFRLWIWASALGNELIVAAPDFDQSPTYQFRTSDMLEIEYSDDATDQPSVIVATGQGGGGPFAKAPLKVAMVNELVGLDANGRFREGVPSIIATHRGVKVSPRRDDLIKYAKRFGQKRARMLYLEDDESRTTAQLEAAVYRKLAECQSKAIVLKITVRGHVFDGSPIAVNTIAHVDDPQITGAGRWWIKERTFTRSREGGTKTSMTLIPPGTMEI